jgi:hypothetical protein
MSHIHTPHHWHVHQPHHFLIRAPVEATVMGVVEASAESKSGESLTAAFWTVGLKLRVHTNGFHSPRKAETFLLVD